MAKTTAKDIVQKIILEIFKGSFINDKNIIIPVFDNETKEEKQVKITMTLSKKLIGRGDAAGDILTSDYQYTEEEKERVKELLKELGL